MSTHIQYNHKYVHTRTPIGNLTARQALVSSAGIIISKMIEANTIKWNMYARHSVLDAPNPEADALHEQLTDRVNNLELVVKKLHAITDSIVL